MGKEHIKLHMFTKRNSNLDHAKYVEIWKGVHMPNVVNDMKPQRYIVNFFNQPKAPAEDPWGNFDGMAQLWFSNYKEYVAKMKSMGGTKAASDDLVKNTDQEAARPVFCRVYVVCDGPRTGVKLTSLLKPAPGVTRKQVCEHYLGKHSHDAKEALRLAGLEGKARYTVNVVLDVQTGPKAVSEWCCLAEIFVPDLKAFGAFNKGMNDPRGPGTGNNDKVWDSLRVRGPNWMGTELPSSLP